jgi:hypothetical protein
MKTLFDMSKTMPVITEVPQASMAILDCGYTKVLMPLLSEEYKSILMLNRCEWPGPYTVNKMYELIAKGITCIHVDSHIYCLADKSYENVMAKANDDYALAP